MVIHTPLYYDSEVLFFHGKQSVLVQNKVPLERYRRWAGGSSQSAFIDFFFLNNLLPSSGSLFFLPFPSLFLHGYRSLQQKQPV